MNDEEVSRDTWEIEASIWLQNASWYLKFLYMDQESVHVKNIRATFGMGDNMAKWAMDRIRACVKHVDKEGARVMVCQEDLDKLEIFTGVKAVSALTSCPIGGRKRYENLDHVDNLEHGDQGDC